MTDLIKGDTALIVDECKARGVLRNQCAYVLATTFWETARTMKPVREYGSEAYLKKKGYYPYVGMGYVQLTWEANYKRAGDELGVDFLADPRKLLDAEYAVKILVNGMVEGWFTGKRLSDYITLQKSDFLNARRIINGTDHNVEIAAIAEDYDQALTEDGYGVPTDRVKVASHGYRDDRLTGARPPGPPGNHQAFWITLAALFGRLFYGR
ncbi:MAG: carboxypeptidase [Hyphomicrobiales bacterium]